MSEVRPTSRPLRRGSDRIVGGVCSGLAATMELDPLLIRIAFVLLTLANGIGILLYLVLWVLIPDERAPQAWSVKGAAASIHRDVTRVGQDVKSGWSKSSPPSAGDSSDPPSSTASPPPTSGDPRPPDPPPYAYYSRRPAWPGLILIVLGLALLANVLGWFWWWNWSIAAPAALVLLGVWLIVRRR